MILAWIRSSRRSAVAMAIAAGVSCKGGPRERGEPCEKSAECRAPLVCLISQKCGKAPPPLLCPENGQPGCLSHSDCGSSAVCSSRCCRSTCSLDQECNAADREQCDVGLCVKEICSATSDCNDPAQVCRSGQCVAKPRPADVAGCLVLPAAAVAVAGSSRRFTAVALDGRGEVLVAPPDFFTWDPGGDPVAVGQDGVATVSASATAPGAMAIRAAVGSVACTAALSWLPAAPAGKMRVVAVDGSGAPLAGATVARLVGGSNTGVGSTGADGSLAFDVGQDPETITVAKEAHDWVTLSKTTARDVLVALPERGRGRHGWQGTVGAHDFQGLEKVGGSLHFALLGSAIVGNLVDFSFDTLFGEQVTTSVAVTPQQTVKLPLPSGMVLGIGATFFKGGGYDPATGAPDPRMRFWFTGRPGPGAVWGLGGNLDLLELAPQLDQLRGGDLDLGKAMGVLLPILSQLQSGTRGSVVSGEVTNSDTLAGLAEVHVPLTQQLRLRQVVELPGLPDTGAEPGAQYATGAVILGGVDAPAWGLVPVGLTAALDVGGPGQAADGKVETGKVPLSVAAATGGVEGGDYVTMAMAVSLAGISLRPDPNRPRALAKLSALVHRRRCGSLPIGTACVPFAPEEPPVVRFSQPAFLALPLGSARSDRTISLQGIDRAADLVRIKLRSDTVGDWFLYVGPGEVAPSFPPAPEGMSDRMAAPDGRFFLQSMALADGVSDLVTFDGRDMDEFDEWLEAFSTLEIGSEE